jgi:hypothetical protein
MEGIADGDDWPHSASPAEAIRTGSNLRSKKKEKQSGFWPKESQVTN